jgi:hypothetical protein
LSPHVDDAAYGLTLHISSILKSDLPLTLINCFTVTRWTAVPVLSKEIKDVMLMRADEDAEYNDLFNSSINIVNLNLLDAPLRKGYIFQQKPFELNEWQLVQELKNYLEKNIDGILLCPLGIGNHIDHAICREAAVKLYSRIKVLFYEDLPYTARISQENLELHVKELEERLNLKLVSYTEKLNKAAINKEQAIRMYKSQMNEEICGEIISYMKLLGGERLWGELPLITILRDLLE